MMANLIPELFCDYSALFNREIGNTAARIQLSWGDERISWARIDASPAASATVWSRTIGAKLKRREDHAQEKP
jgi:hypothetical protein